jgi:hypothetical protein
MALTPADVDEWARTYIEAQLLPEGELTHTHPLWWSVERFMQLTDRERAEDAWTTILEVLSRTRAEEALGILAAGPLEDLISEWGPSFIDRIETEARRNPAFQALLRGVWKSGDPSVCERVAAARKQNDA